MRKPFFSIIVPVYNSEQYINECIDSLVSQSCSDIEIIVIDDGSTDNSSKICIEYANRDKRIKVYKQKNKGVGSARNLGLNKATGDYVMFLDSDDYVDIRMIENLYKYINTKDNDVLYVMSEKYEEKKEKFLQVKTNSEKKDYVESVLMWNNFNDTNKNNKMFSVCNKVYFRELLRKNNIIFNENIGRGEDMLFNIDYIMCVNEIIFIPNYYYYRNNHNSITHKYDNRILTYGAPVRCI